MRRRCSPARRVALFLQAETWHIVLRCFHVVRRAAAYDAADKDGASCCAVEERFCRGGIASLQGACGAQTSKLQPTLRIAP